MPVLGLVVDARQQAGMTKEIAERGIRQAYGQDFLTGGKIQKITVKTPEGDVVAPRKQ